MYDKRKLKIESLPTNLTQYRDVPKLSDRQIWTNSEDSGQTAPDQGQHCLQFHLCDLHD